MAESRPKYDHVFWALAMFVVLILWMIDLQAPQLSMFTGGALVAIVLAGWLTAIWRGNREGASAEAASSPQPAASPQPTSEPQSSPTPEPAASSEAAHQPSESSEAGA